MTRSEGELDRLAVSGIEAFGHHGVFDFEKRDGQTFRVDLVLGFDTRIAAESRRCRTPWTTDASWRR